jgi:hypothetical protein
MALKQLYNWIIYELIAAKNELIKMRNIYIFN